MQRGRVTTICCLTLLTGFLVICLGAFLISMGSGPNFRGKLILAYCFLPLGFLILLSGIFWSTYQQASQSKGIFNRVLRQHLGHEDLQIPTVDRPDFYPPSYEDSIDPEKQISLQQKTFNIPPPLYTESSLEFMDDTDSHGDIPPSYEVSMTNDIRKMMSSLTSELYLSEAELCKVISLTFSSRVIGVQPQDIGEDNW